jgi:hypothetical protein
MVKLTIIAIMVKNRRITNQKSINSERRRRKHPQNNP